MCQVTTFGTGRRNRSAGLRPGKSDVAQICNLLYRGIKFCEARHPEKLQSPNEIGNIQHSTCSVETFRANPHPGPLPSDGRGNQEAARLHSRAMNANDASMILPLPSDGRGPG